MGMETLPQEAQEFLKSYPDTEVIELLVPDMTGIMRGKQLPMSSFGKLFTKGINLGGASNLIDTKGEVVESIIYGAADGDPDMRCFPIAGTLAPVPWAKKPTAQMMMSMEEQDGSPYYAYPRNVLEHALKPLSDLGLTPVVALELEFYLLDASKMPPVPAKPKVDFPELAGGQCYNLDPIYDFHDFIEDIEDACKAQNVPSTSTVIEYGDGQFEVNLNHIDDIVKACDQAMLLKRIVRSVARARGLIATFMAKPFAEQVGSGLHIHMSLLDQNGKNVFAGESPSNPYSDKLHHAVGGLCALMGESMAVFAPNGNSYKRLLPGAYVPVTPNWGPNHRGVAIRLPVADPEDTRFEHRVAGSDANPYLTAACVLAGVHHGIAQKVSPPKMVEEGEVLDDVVTLPIRWDKALDLFSASRVLPTYLGQQYTEVFGACRRWEENRFHNQVSDADYEWYLRTT